jgi:acyl-coenzyme A thioesterase PaaI-like protein
MVEITALPFCKHLGLESIAVDHRTEICLEPGGQHLNHLGTIHAGVLFTLAEAAAAQAMLETFPDLVDQVVVVLRSATIKYRQQTTGPVRGLATIEERAAKALRTRLAEKGTARLDVAASVRDAQQEVFVGHYSWFITRQDANN